MNGTLTLTNEAVAGAAITVAATNSTGSAFAGTMNGLFRSDDGGATWICILDEPDVRGILIHPRMPRSIYAVADSCVFKTVNGGASWRRLTSPEALSCIGRAFDRR